ncbi:MAG: 2-keto-4-pentenoate hydratase [Anaerolineae bacterium]
MRHEFLVTQLLTARRDGILLADVPGKHLPANLDEAYAASDELAQAINGEVAGWKIGASIERSWQRLGLHEPFGGRIFARTVHQHPAVVEHVPATLTIGAEFALRIARDLSTGETSFDANGIRAAIDGVFPVLELNRPSYTNPMAIGGLALIADNGVNYGLVVGPTVEGWQSVDLMEVIVSLTLDGELQSSGKAADIGFDPYEAVAWLANDRAERGDPLRAGQLISSGDLIGPVEANPGSTITADFGSFARVEVRLA